MPRLMKYAVFVVCTVALLAVSQETWANMSYSPWVHKIMYQGSDVEVTVAIFEQTTATNEQGEPFPGIEDAYTLKRVGWEREVIVFENRAFVADEADDVSDFTCQKWEIDMDLQTDCEQSEGCVDCDEDGIDECPGFCGVAHYYKIIDHCPGLDDGFLGYWMFTESEYDLNFEGEGLGFTNYFDGQLSDTGSCATQSDSGDCSVASPGTSASRAGLLSAVLRLLLQRR